jgi:ectoine hydroxylase-related dioxygenase (phytanoyl-CoA dioxygenase family)
MAQQLHQEQLRQAKAHYDQDGYAIFRQVLDPDLIQEASSHIDWLLEKNPGVRPEQLHHYLMQHDPFWVRLVSDDRLLDIAALFVGPNIALFASHYISKPAYDGQAVLWHQDGSYWPLEPMEVVTLFLAIDDSLPENGCMRVIPGTQAMSLQKMRRRTDMDNVLNSEIDPSLVEESRAVDLALKAGDVSVHHPNIIHGSNANNSPRRRAALTIRYIPTSTRIITADPWPSAFLLRGLAVAGVNLYQPRPKYVESRHMPFRGCEAWQ